MIDISDGLLADAGAPGRRRPAWRIDVHTASLEVAEPLHAVAAATGADPVSFVLGGGDDHALLATFPARCGLPDGWTVIGSVAAGSTASPSTVRPYDGPTGLDALLAACALQRRVRLPAESADTSQRTSPASLLR